MRPDTMLDAVCRDAIRTSVLNLNYCPLKAVLNFRLIITTRLFIAMGSDVAVNFLVLVGLPFFKRAHASIDFEANMICAPVFCDHQGFSVTYCHPTLSIPTRKPDLLTQTESCPCAMLVLF